MKKQVLFLMTIMLSTTALFAQDNKWVSTGSTDFGDGANWDLGHAPTVGENWRLAGDWSTADIVVSSVHIGANQMITAMGGGTQGKMTINNGGWLGIDGWCGIGFESHQDLDILQGGELEIKDHLWLTRMNAASATINVSGNLHVLGNWGFDWHLSNVDGGTGEVLGTGLITVQETGIFSVNAMDINGTPGLDPSNAFSDDGTKYKVNIEGNGTMILTRKNIAEDLSDPENPIEEEDWTGKVQFYIDRGNITADGDQFLVVVQEANDVIYITSALRTEPLPTPLTLGVEDKLSTFTLDFAMYPNPTNDIINLKSKTPISNIKLYSSLGQLIMDQSGKSSIDISDLSTGYYILKAEDELGNLGVKKVVKK